MLTPKHLFQNLCTAGIAQMLGWASTSLLLVLAPRYLGEVQFGKLVFGLALVHLISFVTDLGTGTYLTKEVARDPTRAGPLTINALVTRVPLSVLAGIVVLAVVIVGDYDSVTRLIIQVLCLSILLSAITSILGSVLLGLHEMKAWAAWQVGQKLAYAVLGTAALLLGAGPVAVATAYVSSLALALVVATVVVCRRVQMPPRIDWSLWRGILLGALPFFIWQAALSVYAQIDTVLLSMLTHDAVVGWYGAAYRIISILGFLPTVVMTVGFPALSAAAADLPLFNTIARRALHWVTLLSVPMAFGLSLLADRVISLLGYPEGFANSVVPIMVLAPCVPLCCAGTVIGTVLSARDRQKQWALTAVAAAVLNPVLNLVAIPYTQSIYGNGAIGAAVITMATEVFMLAMGLRLLPRGVFGRAAAIGAIKCVGAALGMSMVVYLTRDLPLAILIVLGALVYGAGSLALGTITLGDLRALRLHLLPPQPASSTSA